MGKTSYPNPSGGQTKTGTVSSSDTSTGGQSASTIAGNGNGNNSSQQQQPQKPPKDTSKWDNPETTMEYWGDDPDRSTESVTTNGKSKINHKTIDASVKDQIHGDESGNIIKTEDGDKLLNIQDEYLKDLLENDSKLKIYLPNYGVSDFINERALWQKGTYNTLGEQGWFYFKIFFNFHDSKLFYGLLNIYDGISILNSTCALRYLYTIRNYYKHERIHERIISLYKFTSLLSYINTICPWFFKSISNIGKLNGLNNTDLSKEKFITIQCDADAIDMKLNTLFDLYKYACYDDVYRKEIIPENLRKFDMQVLIMNVPLKYFHSAFMAANTGKLGGVLMNAANKAASKINIDYGKDKLVNNIGKGVFGESLSGPINKITSFIGGMNADIYDFKTLRNAGDLYKQDFMSFQLFTLKNCEFVINDSLEGYYSSALSNENFFNLGNNTIKIKYDNVYKHSYNEWENIFYGSTMIADDNDNLYTSNQFINSVYNEYKTSDNSERNKNIYRLLSIRDNLYNIFFAPAQEGTYKSLIDFSEKMIKDTLINTNNPYYMGNIGDPNVISRDSYLKNISRAADGINNLAGNHWTGGLNKIKNFMQ